MGERVVPAHIFFSQHWLSKRSPADEHTPAMLDEERRYFRDNPHANPIAAAARRTRGDFGRIDYGLLGGLLQVGEVQRRPRSRRCPCAATLWCPGRHRSCTPPCRN